MQLLEESVHGQEDEAPQQWRLQLICAWEQFNGRRADPDAIAAFLDRPSGPAQELSRADSVANTCTPSTNGSAARRKRSQLELLLDMPNSSIDRGRKRRRLGLDSEKGSSVQRSGSAGHRDEYYSADERAISGENEYERWAAERRRSWEDLVQRMTQQQEFKRERQENLVNQELENPQPEETEEVDEPETIEALNETEDVDVTGDVDETETAEEPNDAEAEESAKLEKRYNRLKRELEWLKRKAGLNLLNEGVGATELREDTPRRGRSAMKAARSAELARTTASLPPHPTSNEAPQSVRIERRWSVRVYTETRIVPAPAEYQPRTTVKNIKRYQPKDLPPAADCTPAEPVIRKRVRQKQGPGAGTTIEKIHDNFKAYGKPVLTKDHPPLVPDDPNDPVKAAKRARNALARKRLRELERMESMQHAIDQLTREADQWKRLAGS
jgi:hypothetical protein